MKLLFLSTETRPVIGGVAQALDGWLTGLAERGHTVRMIALLPRTVVAQCSSLPQRNYSERWLALPERHENTLDAFLPFRKIRSALFLLRRRRAVLDLFEEEIAAFAPDWIIFSVINEVCCLPLAIAKQKDLKSAAIVYGTEIHPKRVSNPGWLRKTLASMEKIIAISEFTKGLTVQWGVPAERIAIVHPAITREGLNGSASASGEDRAANGVLRILTICRLVERKGVQTVLDAIAGLNSAQRMIEYHIVGEGLFRADLERRAQALGLNGQVVFHGNVSDEWRTQLVAQSDLFVMTPHETESGDVEGFGIVYLEAGAFGKPVIGSRTGGVPDAVLDGQTGVLVEPENPAALRNALKTLLSDDQARSRLGSKGREWAAEHAPVVVARRLEQVLC